MPHIFISYVRENKDVVDRLCSSLKESQIEVWLDREQLHFFVAPHLNFLLPLWHIFQ